MHERFLGLTLVPAPWRGSQGAAVERNRVGVKGRKTLFPECSSPRLTRGMLLRQELKYEGGWDVHCSGGGGGTPGGALRREAPTHLGSRQTDRQTLMRLALREPVGRSYAKGSVERSRDAFVAQRGCFTGTCPPCSRTSPLHATWRTDWGGSCSQETTAGIGSGPGPER